MLQEVQQQAITAILAIATFTTFKLVLNKTFKIRKEFKVHLDSLIPL